MLSLLTQILPQAFAWPDGVENTEATPTDGGQTSGNEANGQPQESGKVEFSPEQQATLQRIIDKTLAKGIQRGQQQLLGELGIEPDDLPTIKERLVSLKDEDGNDDEEDTEDPQASTGRRTKAQEMEEQWQRRLEQIQKQSEARVAALQEQIEKQREIASSKAIDAELSATLSGFQFAETVDPVEVRNLLKTHIQVDDAMNPVVVDADGNPRLGPTGENLTVQDFVSQWLNERKHYLAPGRSGAGSSSVGTTNTSNPLAQAMANYQPGAIREVLSADPELRQQLRDLLTPSADVNPFAKARMSES